jgi:signal transduction histidine kinase
MLEERVLILAPTRPDLDLAAEVLRGAELKAEVCPGVEDLCGKIGEGAGAALLASEALSEQGVCLLQETLGQAPAWSDLPLILLTMGEGQDGHDMQHEDALSRLGNVTFLERPLGSRTLVTAIRSALRTRRRQYEMRDLLRNQQAAVEHVEERTAQLQETNEQMEAFTYSISHDLRAPLRAIRGFAQALAEDYGPALDATGREYLQRMEQGAERLDRLIQDLLQYSRLGRSTLSLSPISLEASIQHVLQHLEADIRASGGVIEVKKPLPFVIAHEPTLQQVIGNLLSNALKFVAPAVKPIVRVWATEREQTVRLWVADNGIGIASIHHQRIFGVFERLHSTEAYPGTGIGLAIVAKGITRMGGSVGLESAPGEGSRFWIDLPRAR